MGDGHSCKCCRCWSLTNNGCFPFREPPTGAKTHEPFLYALKKIANQNVHKSVNEKCVHDFFGQKFSSTNL